MKQLVVLVLAAGCFSARGGGAASCPQDRTVELGLPEDVRRLAGCTQLAGVVIRTGATLDVAALKELEEIAGDLTIGPTVGVDEIAFNGLVRVRGTIRVANNGSLRGLFFPRLERAGRIEVDNNAVLTSISMPRLASVDGALVVTDNGGLELVSAPRLGTIGNELVISGHPKLELLELSHLGRIEAVRIEGNPKLAPAVIEQLTGKSTLARPPTP